MLQYEYQCFSLLVYQDSKNSQQYHVGRNTHDRLTSKTVSGVQWGTTALQLHALAHMVT